MRASLLLPLLVGLASAQEPVFPPPEPVGPRPRPVEAAPVDEGPADATPLDAGPAAEGAAEGVALPASAEPLSALTDDDLRLRDARLSFGEDSARRARAALEAGLEDPEDRCVAVLALGSAGTRTDVPRIESMAFSGTPRERNAALFALGEMGVGGLAALERVLADDVEVNHDAACLALAVASLRGAARARTVLEAHAARDDAQQARAAQQALAFASGSPSGGLGGQLWRYHDLRWRAARAYGLVDGLRGKKALADQLFSDTAFQDEVLLRAAIDLPTAGLEAHLVEILVASEHPAALRTAALVMPSKLAVAHRADAWKPSLAGWHAMLDAIDRARTERAALELLEIAFREDAELEEKAGILIVRANGDLPWIWVGDRIERGSLAVRRALVEACGDRGEEARIGDIADLLLRRPDLDLFGVGLVALARLGQEAAAERLAELVREPASKERADVLAALARTLHDPAMRRHAHAALKLDDLTESEQLDLRIALAAVGSAEERAILRTLLPEAPRHEKRVLAVRALANEPGPKDVELFDELFPAEDRELDVELALVLMRQRHVAVAGLLRAALWGGAWNRSVLAGGLIELRGGERALLDELALPPVAANEADLRRVGFALGEWCGLGAVESLARTRDEGDPVLQGALLGALSTRAGLPEPEPDLRLPPDVDFPPPGPVPGAGKGGKAPQRGAAGGRRGGRGRRGG